VVDHLTAYTPREIVAQEEEVCDADLAAVLTSCIRQHEQPHDTEHKLCPAATPVVHPF
jgi:hypothetical protein